MNKEGLKCIFCDGDLRWESDANADEVYDNYEGDDGAVIGYYTCTKCGRSYEIVDPPKEERDGEYKEYWNV